MDLNATDSNLPPSGASPSRFDSPDVDTHSCQLMGPTALVVQALMGVLVILSLVYKRHREKPMRPWRIWIFDVSKQIVGQMFVHGVNVLVSDLVSKYTTNNACVFYFLNILIDTTLGVGLLYAILRFLTFVMTERLQLKGFESGVYGTPPSFKFWLRQASIYVCALCTMKLMVIVLLALLPGLFTLGSWLLSWTWTGEGDSIQVIFTMGIFPICMNILQFWLIDSIVKASGVALDMDSPDPLDREPLFRAPDDDDNDDSAFVQGPTDIEHRPRPRSQSPESTGSDPSDTLRTPSETKYSGGSTPTQPIDVETHAYPPSVASSTSSSPLQAQVIREATKLKPKRRGVPAPIHIQNHNRPAVNSPRTAPNTANPAPPPDNDWGDSWDDQDDWADKVGEEEWTGKRMEEKKGQLSAWDTGSPLVNSLSMHVEAAS
ncbi:hypothetical protein MIND_00769200 [Mycena indigotica]|uniref:Vacuolar membrane protein n=1 Tax=Mycena indigotica TaxID=2126181 RepID=A0A8H6W511_9AGAR|nr:uncharacterized protein MIND_00769200 [Mycena indigotica]KAF7302028.1 hypothetical protein MIND_00769200 [Mycena indigotica]